MKKQTLNKFAMLERSMAAERGDFSLFALALREDVWDRWDVLVAAPWLKTGDMECLGYVASKLQDELTTPELISLSRIVILEKSYPVLAEFHDMVQVQHGLHEVGHCQVGEVALQRVYIFTSTPEPAPLAPAP